MRPRPRFWLKGGLVLAALALAGAAFLQFAPKPAVRVDAQMRLELVDGLARQLAAHYVFPDKGARMGDLIRARHGSGAYDALNDADQLAAAVSADLQGVVRVRDTWTSYPSSGLTPERLASILRDADAGDILRQLQHLERAQRRHQAAGTRFSS